MVDSFTKLNAIKRDTWRNHEGNAVRIKINLDVNFIATTCLNRKDFNNIQYDYEFMKVVLHVESIFILVHYARYWPIGWTWDHLKISSQVFVSMPRSLQTRIFKIQSIRKTLFLKKNLQIFLKNVILFAFVANGLRGESWYFIQLL